jgi:hypothetical protein
MPNIQGYPSEETADRVAAYQEEHDLTQSKAVVQLVEAGLERKGFGVAADGGQERLGLARKTLIETEKALFFICFAWLAVSAFTVADMALPAVVAGALGLLLFSVEPRLDRVLGVSEGGA